MKCFFPFLSMREKEEGGLAVLQVVIYRILSLKRGRAKKPLATVKLLRSCTQEKEEEEKQENRACDFKHFFNCAAAAEIEELTQQNDFSPSLARIEFSSNGDLKKEAVCEEEEARIAFFANDVPFKVVEKNQGHAPLLLACFACIVQNQQCNPASVTLPFLLFRAQFL